MFPIMYGLLPMIISPVCQGILYPSASPFLFPGGRHASDTVTTAASSYVELGAHGYMRIYVAKITVTQEIAGNWKQWLSNEHRYGYSRLHSSGRRVIQGVSSVQRCEITALG